MTEPGQHRGPAAVLAIDGGNSKTDLALVGWDGTLLAAVRGPGASHEDYGIDGAMRRLGDMVAAVARQAGIGCSGPDGPGIIAAHVSACLAGADLPDEAVIEVPAVIGASGPVPMPVAPLPPLLRGLVGHVSAYEELAVDAALRGGRQRVASALLAHPLIGQRDLAERMADRLIAENQRFLAWA